MQDMVDTSHESVQFAGVQWKRDKFKNSKFVTLQCNSGFDIAWWMPVKGMKRLPTR